MTVIDIQQTKLTDKDGQPMTLFHATPVEGGIKRYLPLSHFGTSNAANLRAAYHFVEQSCIEGVKDMGEVWKKPLLLIEKSNRSGLRLPSLSCQKVNLYMQNPLKIRDLGRHDLQDYFLWFRDCYKLKPKFLSSEEWLDLSIPGKPLGYKKLLTEFIFYEPFRSSRTELIKELRRETLFDASKYAFCRNWLWPEWLPSTPDDSEQWVATELASRVALQRMIRFLEGEGYDGLEYQNTYEDKGSTSYIIFRPEQVFNMLTGEKIHQKPAMTLADRAGLLRKERKFFSKHKVLSPSERITLAKKSKPLYYNEDLTR